MELFGGSGMLILATVREKKGDTVEEEKWP